MAKEERALAEMARRTLDIIKEDGTTVVFPRIVEQLEQDLQTVARFLDGQNTGSYTQDLQKEIEKTLEELIEALEKAREQQEQQGQQQQGEQSEMDPPLPPLVPNSAELKLLKSAQLRVNRRTASFDKVRPEGNLQGTMRREIHRIADRQEDVRQMAEDMVEN
jgi:exonuclease VII large subunit